MAAKRSARRCKFSQAVEAARVLKHCREEFTTLVLNWEGSRACQMSKSWQITWQHYWRRNDVKANQCKGVIPLFH